MTMRAPSFWMVLALVLGAVAYAFEAFDLKSGAQAPVAGSRVDTPRDPMHENVDALLGALRRAPVPEDVSGRPFGASTWQDVVSAQPPAPPAAAPKFPFRYAGKLQEGDGPLKVYLARGEDVFLVRKGDVHDGFRIDAIHDGRLEVTYVAGGQQLSMQLSSMTDATAEVAAASDGNSAPTRTAALDASQARVTGDVPAVVRPADAPPQLWFAGGLSGSVPESSAGGLGNASPTPSLTVGAGAAPASGSMPTAASTLPPAGTLGVSPSSSGRLGSEPTNTGQLGS